MTSFTFVNWNLLLKNARLCRPLWRLFSPINLGRLKGSHRSSFIHGQDRPGSTASRNLAKWSCYAGLLSTLGLASDVVVEPKDTRRYIEDAIKRAIHSHKELGDAKTAEQQLHLALKMAQETIDAEAITYIYDALANLALETGRLDDAEKLFMETTKRLVQSGVATDDDAILEISLKLADVYAAQGRADVAEVGYLYCLDCLQKKQQQQQQSDNARPVVDEEHNTVILWAMCSDAYGRFLMAANRFTEARKHFGDALDVCRRVHGPTHPQTLVIVNNVAGACAMVGDYATAAAHLENAVNITGSSVDNADSSSSTSFADLSSYYRNLGVVYMHMGRLDEARLACQRALAAGIESKDQDMEREARECLLEVRKHKK